MNTSSSLVISVSPANLLDALLPLERLGLDLVALKHSSRVAEDAGARDLVAAPTVEDCVHVVLRCPPVLLARSTAMCASLAETVPSLRACTHQQQALQLLYEHFGSRDIAQWKSQAADAPLLGDPDEHGLRCFAIDELTRADSGSCGAAFCAQLRRDGFVPLLVPKDQRHLFKLVERDAADWFSRSEEDKLEQAGAYGHVDRKFTGYRMGKFREQLEVRPTAEGGVYPMLSAPADFAARLALLLRALDRIARSLLAHVAADVGVAPEFFDELVDPPRPGASRIADALCGAAETTFPPNEELNRATKTIAEELRREKLRQEESAELTSPAALGHSLIRLCRYDSKNEGVAGSGVLCEAHNDVGLITLDPCADVPGLQALRRADGLWVAVEDVAPPAEGGLLMMAMVGDTLGRLTASYYSPCKHRVMAPPRGERIGLPFLFRGRSDAVLNTRNAIQEGLATGKKVHLAEMETTTIKELPAFDSAKSILRNWFRSVKK
uniref:Fe2OG dioxygenase domain-containing protein n=1 Tax=Calcidiscus leptoporus TaxID=127549 RepID=A0A7S0IST1_9EUKA|mmetsp:Transcript_19808/g.45633  ORF Transcript_19808/g.45633 Transcript_19808/m.45633 type:complete len:495 (+) Transcript_19808:3-1487(+)